MAKPRVLIVDDRPNILKLLSRILKDYDVSVTTDPKQALARVSVEEFDLVVTDMRMPDISGMDILKRTKEIHPDTQVVVMTAYGEIGQAVEAMKHGALDYITKPFEPEVIELVAEKAVQHRRIVEQARAPAEEADEAQRFGDILGKSDAMRKAFNLLSKAAGSESTVLIQGESGTGKELFARAIHYSSRREACPFVPVNCGAIPHELMESELFGHARGAFTGAVASRPGLFREADKGTLFLDEISELPADMQIKLTRVIQEREVRPVGETRTVKVDVRILAATNRNLRELVDRGQFREDLYFRVSVFPITAPPLRERKEDIPLLVSHFIRRFAEREAKPVEGIEPDALRALMEYHWPGNVRELENVVERAVLLVEGALLTAATVMDGIEYLPGKEAEDPLLELPHKEAMEIATRQASRQYAVGLLRRTHGNVTKAADLASMERESFHRLLRKLGINAQDFRE